MEHPFYSHMIEPLSISREQRRICPNYIKELKQYDQQTILHLDFNRPVILILGTTILNILQSIIHLA